MATMVGMTAKDLINAKTASMQLKSAPERFTCTGIAISTDTDKSTGEIKQVGYAVADDGTVYGTISATAISSLEAIVEAIESESLELPLDIGMTIRKSNAGRDFIVLSVF